MHLKQLKLAGFKSFVDPTLVYFPSQLVAVVGPNGCGKSNIIDAVRWVMGESSAKTLRGESMVDVIFNGSSNRKAVGQASVELIFDNDSGRIGGSFTSYGEIAVRRVVARNGDSSYYLNGVQCRRRDITDIFLGTGAGTRGYSIIGQGTISRLIEAKPEELRIFLEEAAGVSKYKERRRETLQRIAHTRENLIRIADIRDELGKQLQRLQRQAKTAQQYIQLKEEEQLYRVEILAFKWQEFTQQKLLKQQVLFKLAQGYEQKQSLLSNLTKERALLTEALNNTNEQLQQSQASFYQSGIEIARLEQIIQQQEREQKRLELDRQQMQEDWQTATVQLKAYQEELVFSQEKAQQLQDQLTCVTHDFKNSEVLFQERRKQQVAWDIQWQELQSRYRILTGELQVNQVNLNHLNQKQQHTVLNFEQLKLEQSEIVVEPLYQAKKTLAIQQFQLTEQVELDEKQLEDERKVITQFRIEAQDIEQLLHQLHDELFEMNSKHAVLVASQKAARTENNEKVAGWADKSRLMDILHVDFEWQAVCDKILANSLQAYVLEDLAQVWPRVAAGKQGEHVITMRNPLAKTHPYPCLADKITGYMPATIPNLDSIYTAQSLDEAITWLPTLAEHESVVTLTGFWLGKGWIKGLYSPQKEELGVLARQQKIVEVEQKVQDLDARLQRHKIARDEHQLKLQQSLSKVDLFQLNLAVSKETLRANINAQNMNEQALIDCEKKSIFLKSQSDELQYLLEEIALQNLELTDTVKGLDKQFKECEQQQAQLLDEKQSWINTLELQNKHTEELRTVMHQAEIALHREVTQIKQLNERLKLEHERLSTAQERLERLALDCMNASSPKDKLQEQLAENILKHNDLETQLTLSHEQIKQLKTGLEHTEQSIRCCDLELKKGQDFLSQTRLQEQELSVRACAVQESLDELALKAELLLKQIPKHINQNMREDELMVISEKIRRLEPINLAAIEEFATEEQRKIYLDEQHEDLSQALVTLETAIEKMDKETHTRLQHAFDEVNAFFKALFPKLFGGGRAQLELTCDNLLEAGIVVMAQPPGKRNSTIHLLSGGEKAMTAVALVFAIFQLNPSPFCMLDEVDAPLDDANVERFCDLVKEMSQFVQFLFITHNKVTMELANHLIGVTMREPGVSRLVTVDVKQALTME